jgi:AcrR family transcriptional regulator
MAIAAARRTPKFRRRAEARPDEVLDAALDLFIENGFAATRVDDIAKRAGLSKGAVYLYFPSKEAIIEALVRRALVPVASNAAAFVAHFDGDPRIAVTTVMKMLAGAMANPRFMAIPKLVVREVVNFPELAAMYRRELLDHAIPVLEGLIRRGVDNGYLRQVDPALTVRSVVGAFIAHLMLAEVFGIVPPDGLALDRLVDNHLLILFEGLSRKPGGAE